MTTQNFHKISLIATLLLTVTTVLTGCTEYWWTRGQPPAVNTLITRSHTRLQEALKQHQSTRSELVPVVNEIESSLTNSLASLEQGSPTDTAAALEKAKQAFMQLEGKLSIGSRASYGELSGQLRVLASAENAKQPDPGALGLFTARTYFFLANEFAMAPPTFG